MLAGFMGTGKSAAGRLLAKGLKVPFVDLDERIVRQAGQTVPEIFAKEGESGFRKREAREVTRVCTKTGQVIATGGGVLLNEENVRQLKEAGILICLTARPEVILSRTLSSLPSRPLLSGTDPRERIEELLKLRKPSYAKADVTIDTSDRSVQGVVEEILRILKEEGILKENVRDVGESTGAVQTGT